MYVRDTDPLPRNSQDPLTACEVARAQSIVSSMEQAVAKAQAASASIAGPSSFAQFGPAVVIDVARSQNGMASAGITAIAPFPFRQSSNGIAGGAESSALECHGQEYSGCSTRGTGGFKLSGWLPRSSPCRRGRRNP